MAFLEACRLESFAVIVVDERVGGTMKHKGGKNKIKKQKGVSTLRRVATRCWGEICMSYCGEPWGRCSSCSGLAREASRASRCGRHESRKNVSIVFTVHVPCFCFERLGPYRIVLISLSRFCDHMCGTGMRIVIVCSGHSLLNDAPGGTESPSSTMQPVKCASSE